MLQPHFPGQWCLSFKINNENVFPVQLVKSDTIPELDIDHVLAPPPDHVLLVQDAGVVHAAVVHGQCSTATLHVGQ